MKKTQITKAILAFGGNVNEGTINNLSAYTINNLSAYTINNLSAYTINNLSADTINNLSADTINNLSADTIKNLSAKAKKVLELLWEEVPLIDNIYTTLLADIKEKRRVHNQSDFGPSCDPKTNLCGTQMCTAGHLVNMSGEWGYKRVGKWGWEKTAALVHMKAHPDAPTQNFGNIPQADAIAYIEMMAEFEGRKNKNQKFENWLKSVMEAE